MDRPEPLRQRPTGNAAVDAARRGSGGRLTHVLAGRLTALPRNLMRGLADIAMPSVCLACHDPLDSHDRLCPACWSDVDFIRAPLCDRLGIPMPFDTGGPMISAAAEAAAPGYDRARAVARYGGTMRRLIHDYKYHDRHEGCRLFVDWLSIAGHEVIGSAELVVPVPLHRWRLLTRRFNQSALLARDLARRHGLAYRPDILRRVRHTRPQVGLSHAQRRDNLEGAFRIAKASRRHVEGRAVLLIDDVITTGSTADRCARVLKRAGATRVDVLALAMVADHARMTT